MNEETIPSFKRADSLLPFAARAALGLPTYQDLERRMEYYLDTLVKAAGTVHFFFVENADKEKSRFVEKLIWERQKRERDPQSDKYVKTVRYRLALQAGEPNPVTKTSDVAEYLREFAFSATSLDMYLKCPVRFYYAYVLKLKEKEEIAEPMNKKDIGTFVHAILEEYFKKWTGRRIRAEDLDANVLDAIVERRFNEEYGRDPAGSAYLMKLQVKRHMREFILDYQIPVIRAVEEKGGELHIQTLEQRIRVERSIGGTSFKLAAKVDRVEKRGEEL
jgi:ATP-dependent helicase/DNAse subunit B